MEIMPPRSLNELLAYKLEQGSVRDGSASKLLELLSSEDQFSVETFELLQSVVAECSSQLPVQVLEVLEIAAGKAEQCDPESLSAVHVLLAQFCAANEFGSYYLQIFMKPSLLLPPSCAQAKIGQIVTSEHSEFMNSLKAITSYFADFVQIRTRERCWQDAAIAAALVVSLDPTPSTDQHRIWVLLELVAYGSAPTSIPTGAASVRRQTLAPCELVTSYARYFEAYTWANWKKLNEYIYINSAEIARWRVVELVNESRIKFALLLIRSMMRHISVVPLESISSKLEIESSELITRGLTEFCVLETVNGQECLKPLENQSRKDIAAFNLLETTAEYVKKSQSALR